ncbi:serine/threonine-protein phosphatase PGAM5, mitochondrial [Galendromus occidentalis]|uniref:Serine/threonine-protein phosphatase PGAM5, mitochondrial n=1 Tax=Galendromus occidentalis TaxID=34638 RepID=A0AAJ6QU98_9ACAR|nr:serine/threonine-protein phosphatase PGAM5, mitochondrial [Galendromus occidentalis]
MFIRLSGSLVGIATSAFFISNKVYAKDATKRDSDSCPVHDRESVFKKIHTPKYYWDINWDRRDPKTIYSTMGNPPPDTCDIPHKSRHLYLVRHGQYHSKAKRPEDKKLTELGRKQAEFTGQRLRQLNLTFDKVYVSTMARAKETGSIIVSSLPEDRVKSVELSDLLPEGSPVPPEPPSGYHPASKYSEDGARIEAAFRKFFHRADPSQREHEHILLVCHANVIRYFVCRALQIPEEAWLRFSLKNGSITHLEIRPSGRVVARGIGDAGFMPLDMITTS